MSPQIAISADGCAIHPFERAGLGKAPFRYVGHFESKFQAAPGEPVKAGSSCDYCTSPIMQCYRVQSADGRTFKVGCDCIAKVGDKRLTRAVNAERLKRDRAKRAAKSEASKSELDALMADESFRGLLASKPHPKEWAAAKGETLLDWAEWMQRACGHKGRVKLIADLKAVRP